MVIVLPIAYISILLVVGNSRFGTDWRQAALRAAMLWMAFLVLLTEILSLFNAITRATLLLGWLVPIIGGGIYLWRKHKAGIKIQLPKITRPEGWLDWFLFSGIIFYLVMTALVAFLAPPNTFDSLNYHMARVAHWAQNQSLRHFVTGIDIQNSYAPGAEMTILNSFVLTGNDHFANFIEWSASVGCMLGVVWIAYQLGAKHKGQQLAAIFLITLPMGIAQASSTMNDYVVSFWIICVVAELLFMIRQKTPISLLFTGMAAGFAFLTKPTSAAYLIPLGIWTSIVAFRVLGTKTAILWGTMAILIGLMVNLPHLARNEQTYHNIFDPAMSSTFSNELRTWQGTLSIFLKHLAVHAGTPWPKVNAAEYLALTKVHDWLGMDLNDPRTTQVGKLRISPPIFNEIRIYNPLHAWVAFISIIILFINSRKDGKSAILLTIANIAALVIFSYLFKWQTFAVRYTLPFFVLFSPIAGYAFSKPGRILQAFASFVSILLLIVSLPWLFRIEQRPLVNNPEGVPYAGKNLFNTAKDDWYFVNSGDRAALNAISGFIAQSSCHQVGISISGNSPEYLYWVALNAPRSDLRIEWITSNSATGGLEDQSFKPCAIICEGCNKDKSFDSLPKVLDNGVQQLFLEP